jgi:hypothetical protein
MINYKGAFLNELDTAIEMNPEMSIGNLLYSILNKQNLKGVHYFYASDEEIVTGLENFVKLGVDDDETISTNDYIVWANNKF